MPLSATLHRFRMLAPIAVLCLAAVLRFWALGRPDSLVFDELYYVRDAVSQLAHGFPTTWPDGDPAFGGERSGGFSDEASVVAHPPLGKWLISLGILLFGADTGWGWRSAVALAGVATVGLTMRLGWLLTRSLWAACLAGLLLAIDGVHVVLTRVALLDGFLACFIVLGALFLWRDSEAMLPRSRAGTAPNGKAGIRVPPRRVNAAPGQADPAPARSDPTSALGAILWRRPWLLAAGLTFGAAAAIKWSGAYPFAAFLLLGVAFDVARRRRLGVRRPVLGGSVQALVTGAIALPAALVAYVASWAGWIANPGGQNRVAGEPWWVSLWRWHADSLAWHSTLTAEHPYQAHPLTWPLALRPTAMYEVRWPQGADCPWVDGCAAAISPLPNLLVTWGGVAALLLLLWVLLRSAWIAARTRGRALSPLASPVLAAAAFILVGYLSGWLPWVLTFSRSAVFQFYAVVLTPFAALALGLLLSELVRASTGTSQGLMTLAGVDLDRTPEGLQSRRLSVAVFLCGALILAVLFFPVWSGMPVADWFWRAHLWLPGWN